MNIGICDIEDISQSPKISRTIILNKEKEIAKQIFDLPELGETFKQGIDPTDPLYNPHFKQSKFQSAMNKIDDPYKIVEPMRRSINKELLRKFMLTLLDFCSKSEQINEKIFRENLRKTQRVHKINYTNRDLFYQYNVCCQEDGIIYNDFYRTMMCTKSMRSQAGVMVYGVVTPPEWKEDHTGRMKSFSCEYDCSYCPEQPGRPRSYIDGEPGLDRAHSVGYDVIKQVHVRVNSYRATGHINDKAEVIVLGGTWHSYPQEFRIQFITDMYYAFNTAHQDRGRPKLSMEKEIEMNQISKCRVIGLTLETRPDRITPKELILMRKMGCTRIQIGIQHTDDRVLRRIRRNCTALQCIQAIKLIKDFGFKLDIHVMPDLPKPYTDRFEKENYGKLNSKNLVVDRDSIDWDFDMVAADIMMFDMITNHPDWQADQWKIYPCEVIPWTLLKDEFEKGLHIPYGSSAFNGSVIDPTNPLIMLLIRAKSLVKPWVRLNRVIRDIPEDYISGGIKNMGGRQAIEKEMKKNGLVCRCKRCREIKKNKINPDTVHFDLYKYNASDGVEYDLQFNTNTDQLIGFLRLRFTDNAGSIVRGNQRKIYMKNLVGCALIRELHVYGEAVEVNRTNKNNNSSSQQHNGYGTQLIIRACQMAVDNGYQKIAVIAGEGVRPYYRRFGFVDSDGVDRMMIMDLKDWINPTIKKTPIKNNNMIILCIHMIILVGFIVYFFM